MRIIGAILRVGLLLGVLGFTAVNALASGPGTQPDPDGPGAVSVMEGSGTQPDSNGRDLQPGFLGHARSILAEGPGPQPDPDGPRGIAG